VLTSLTSSSIKAMPSPESVLCHLSPVSLVARACH
jgi:hypothetical protein